MDAEWLRGYVLLQFIMILHNTVTYFKKYTMKHFHDIACVIPSGDSYRSLIGVNEEDLDDDFKLSPARLCNLVGRLSHNWKRHSE